MYKAYILSREHGTVQIGDTVFQPATGNSFKAGKPRKGEYLAIVDVKNKSMESAREALQKNALQQY